MTYYKSDNNYMTYLKTTMKGFSKLYLSTLPTKKDTKKQGVERAWLELTAHLTETLLNKKKIELNVLGISSK